MAENLEGLRKEYMASDSFRLILMDAIKHRPTVSSYRPIDRSMTTQEQTDEWKSKSAMQEGFDLCFKYITGRNPEDLK